MRRFLAAEISERQLFEEVSQSPQIPVEALYLSSAFVLPRQRGRGLARKALLQSVHWMLERNPRPELFCWNYSPEGAKTAAKLAPQLAEKGVEFEASQLAAFPAFTYQHSPKVATPI
jgi:hypothetical protein